MKNLYVLKFGGSSVATAFLIKNVAKRIKTYWKRKKKVIVVVSAPGKTTDHLINIGKQVNPEAKGRELDMLLSTGEQQSIALLALALEKENVPAISFTGQQVGILTDPNFTKARIKLIDRERIQKELLKNKVVIVAGFQGVTEKGDITTLGRGGSDLTAVAVASVFKANLCEIFTDVSGVYSCDPRIVKNAKKIKNITYDEMLELASAGAKVMQSRAMEVAKRFNVSLHIRSTFLKEKGTFVREADMKLEEVVVSGATHDENQVKVSITDVPDRPGVAALVFGKLARKDINVDMIIQSAAKNGRNDISFTIREENIKEAKSIIEKIQKKLKAGGYIIKDNVAKVSIIGIGMRSHSGVASRMFNSLAKAGINIEMISTSEIKISCIINRKDAKKAVRVLANEFNLVKRR